MSSPSSSDPLPLQSRDDNRMKCSIKFWKRQVNRDVSLFVVLLTTQRADCMKYNILMIAFIMFLINTVRYSNEQAKKRFKRALKTISKLNAISCLLFQSCFSFWFLFFLHFIFSPEIDLKKIFFCHINCLLFHVSSPGTSLNLVNNLVLLLYRSTYSNVQRRNRRK